MPDTSSFERPRERSPPGSSRRRSGLPSLKTASILLVVAVAVPLLALAGGAVWQVYRAERARAEDGLLANARSIALLVDREFARCAQALAILAASDALTRGDLAVFRGEMQAAARQLDAAAINLIDPNGRLRVSTAWALEERRDVFVTSSAVPSAIAAGETAISNLYVSPSFGGPAVGVTVPVDARGTRQGIGLVLPRSRLLRAFAELPRPADSISLVMDRNH